jgi:hypothetical protein
LVLRWSTNTFGVRLFPVVVVVVVVIRTILTKKK